jgi:hypothetical protein
MLNVAQKLPSCKIANLAKAYVWNKTADTIRVSLASIITQLSTPSCESVQKSIYISSKKQEFEGKTIKAAN